MVEYAQFALIAGTLLVVLALAADVAVVTLKPAPVRRQTPAYAGIGGRTETPAHVDEPAPATGHGMAWYGTQLARLALAFLTASLVLRSLATGHGPFANQHEFAVSFAWGMLAAYIFFEWRYRVRSLALLMLPITAAMLCYATTVDAEVEPLVPALQHNLLLTLHVATAVLAYGAAAVAFAAAVLYLVHPRISWRGMPREALLDELGYRAAVLSYPLMTIMIILGAIWADIAWGTLLELGSQGDRGAADVADLRRVPARPRGARLARPSRRLAAHPGVRRGAVHILRQPLLRGPALVCLSRCPASSPSPGPTGAPACGAAGPGRSPSSRSPPHWSWGART